MRITKLSMMLLGTLSFAALLNGCGSSSKESAGTPADVASVSESSCAVCHSSSISLTTGSNIYQDYIASAHNLVPGAAAHYPGGVGCQGCHGGGAQHNGVGPLPYSDPSASGKCFSCHKNYLPAAHFKNYTTNAGTRPAMYASKNFQSDCTACHDPHKADKGISQEHRDWADSKHGDVNGLAWANRDFKNSVDCIRCHTSTGLINYVESGYKLPTATWAQAGDFTREVATCKTCHTSYAYGERVRPAGQYTAPYTDAPTKYPNIGKSNLCITCHTGRISGDSIKNSTSDFSNTSFKNSHYLTAGGTVFSKSGFHYEGRNYDSNISRTGAVQNYPHDDLGVSATGTAAADAYIAANGLSSSGPCVVCHLTSEKLGVKSTHTFAPFTEYAAGDVALNPVCVTCHGRGAGSNAKTAWFEETWKLRADAGLDALKAQLALKGFNYTTGYPYFAAKNWGDATTGKPNMGAAFNYNLLAHDPGAVAHNRYYTRRLTYDSIDWLDDGILNYSVFATLNALDATTETYKADAITFLIADTDNVTAGVQGNGTAAERY